MKVKITEKGVYEPTKDGDQEVPVGTVIEVGKELPQALVNKCIIIGKEPEDAVAVTNEDDIEAVRAELTRLEVQFHPQTGIEKLKVLLAEAQDGE